MVCKATGFLSADSQPARSELVSFQRRSFGLLRSELLGKPGHVIGEDRRLLAGARDGDVAETGT